SLNVLVRVEVRNHVGRWNSGRPNLRRHKQEQEDRLVFVGIVFVLSLVFAIPNIMKDHTPAVRAGDVPNLQAMQLAQTPAWLCVVNPILGADGVLLGARMKKLPPV